VAKVLVTGGAGFLGREIVRALAERGDTAIALDLSIGEALKAIAAERPAVRVVVGDITDRARIEETVRDEAPDAVIHCAAVVGVPASVTAPTETMRVNVEGALNLLEAMRLAGVPRMIHMSTEEVYGPFTADPIPEEHPCRPVMPYGISKYAVEQLARGYAQLHDLECIHVRTCWVYGPGLPRPRVPKTFVDAALKGQPLHPPSGGDFRVDHTYVADLVAGVLAALDKSDHPFDVYNIGTGTAPSLTEIVHIIKELVPGADISVGPGDYRFDDRIPVVRKGALDISRARQHLGYAPKYDIRAGLRAYIEAAHTPGT
jgi:UDP-glucose 4-epimerase